MDLIEYNQLKAELQSYKPASFQNRNTRLIFAQNLRTN